MGQITLGPFELSHRIGRGGMGDVYRGRHTAQGVDVAVKIITADRAQNTQYLRAFRNEVHSMARLDHPGIVMVFDVGEITDEAATLSQGRMRAGSPFVTMELATHGTLSRVREGLHWRRLRAVLYGVLDALAHAHARGVIHRDLKPGNVLLTQTDEGKTPLLKLVDFGLAHAMDSIDRDQLVDDPDKLKIAGTPRYMAPEQIQGRWRDQGPWTDLYALGCLTHYLVHGVPPFSGDLEEILAGHLYDAPRLLDPVFEVPPGFQAWVDRLLTKNPQHRFRRAADAAFELLQLAEIDAARPLLMDGFGSSLEEITDQTWTETEFGEFSKSSNLPSSAPQPPVGSVVATIADMPDQHFEERTTPSEVGRYDVQTPMPSSWRRRDRHEESMKLIGAGLGLYGVRSIPLIAREHERDQAWRVLCDVFEKSRTRALVFRGAAGNGKSRLAEWLCERAHETGVASVVKAASNRNQSGSEALRRMMTHVLRTHSMTRREAKRRIEELSIERTGSADIYACHALARIVVPEETKETEDEDVSFLSQTERFTLVRRYLGEIAAERPVIVWLDDAQWSIEALEFATFLLREDRTDSLPICVIITIREEAVKPGRLESKLLSSLEQNDATEVVPIEALPKTDHERLVRELLSLEGRLAHDVAERTGGNPLFAVQLVGDWVQRGVLEVKPEGFSLREGETAPVPRTILQVWRERVTRFVQTYNAPGPARIALEMAAALGDEIDVREWEDACGRLGVTIADDFVDRLVESRMAARTEEGWTFSHGMLRETLIKEFDSSRQCVRYHRAYVEALRELYPETRRDIQERIASHQLSAGDLSRALEPLLDAASWRNQTCDFEHSQRLLAEHAKTLNRLKIPETDERWGQNWLLQIASHLRKGIVDDKAQFLVEKGNELAQAYDWACRPTFVMRRASVARKLGNTDDAERYYREALELFKTRDLRGVGRCLYGIGESYLYRGKTKLALECFVQARDFIPQKTEAHALLAIGFANAYTRLDQDDDARSHLKDAVKVFERIGNRNGLATALNALGELERRRRSFVEAAQAYDRAAEILRSIGSKGAVIPMMNQGLMCIANEDYDAGKRLLEEGLRQILDAGERSHLGLLYVTLLPCVAHENDWDTWDHYISEALKAIASSSAVDPEIQEHAELAERMARERGQVERAIQARALAATQRAALMSSETR